MSLLKPAVTLLSLAGALSLSPQVQAADPAPLSGQILGQVTNPAGDSQMGATVLLYNRYDQVIRRALSDSTGRFAFDALAPDQYSIRVTMSRFVPALRRNIIVLAGSANLLKINLATLFSSIELVPDNAARGILMGEDWKWVLRSSSATRPVLRLRPQVSSSKTTARASMFEDINGVLQFSAGDSNLFNGGLQQDLGTGFAVEASVKGATKVRLSGNFGYGGASSLPSAAFRTTYVQDRHGLPGPQMSLTVRQIYLPTRTGSGAPSQEQTVDGRTAPALRTASFSTIDSVELAGILRVEYGFSVDTITLFGRINYFSPFARATYDLDGRGALKLAFSSGKQPSEMLARTQGSEQDMNADLAVLSQMPRISRRSEHAAVQRTKSYEAGYQFAGSTRTYEAAVYREDVRDAVFLMSGAVDSVSVAELLPDLSSRGIVYNVGDYTRSGFLAAVTQQLGELTEVTLAAGRGGALVADSPGGEVTGDIRSQIRRSQRSWATIRAATSLPFTGTNIGASYGWTDFRALSPVHVSLTGKTNQQVGWTIQGRQPLPGFNGTRMELNAELRNLLAQGYLSVVSPDGRKAVLTNSPRAVRGGLSIIF